MIAQHAAERSAGLGREKYLNPPGDDTVLTQKL